MLGNAVLCKICSEPSLPWAVARVLAKHDVQYFQCPHCGFTQTETPYWVEQAYADAINESDLGLVGRNITLSRIVRSMIFAFFDRDAKFLDYGGGYGLLVRIMRDAGFDFYRSDKFCANLFARQFEAEAEGKQQYELVTAFEVFEHMVNPLEEIEQILAFSRNVLFTTLLMPPHKPNPDEWWYYGLDNGQHVALYTPQALAWIADRLDLNLYTNGISLHLFTERRLPAWQFRLLALSQVARLVGFFSKRTSLLASDYFRMTGKRLE